MINKEKIAVYKRFKGDVDAWARSGSKHQLELMEDSDWFLISSFKEDIDLVEKGLASDDFALALQKRLEENCDSLETISLLKEKDGKPESFLNKLISRLFGKK